MDIPPGGFSLHEFLELHHYSLDTFKLLRKRGLAPRETLLPHSKYTRITAEDYRAWLELIAKPENQFAEFQRRHAIFVKRGRSAKKSPNHPSNLWPKLKRQMEATE
jgi:hypothetical protein